MSDSAAPASPVMPLFRTDVSPVALTLISVCFALSGAAALIYQIAWTRQFALIFGTAEVAVATVLAAYMGGLGLGAALVQPLLSRLRRPLATYAVLESAVALSAVVLLPAGLWLSQWLLLRLFGGQAQPPSSRWGGSGGYYLISAWLVLLLPTVLMGATLPLLARHAVRSDADIGRRVGALYACNTAGAVAGALLTALLLLPCWGLQRTVWTAAALNLLIAAAAGWLDRHTPPAQTTAMEPLAKPLPALPDGRAVLWLMLVSGAVSFLHEVLWTRLLSHLLGSSIFAFGIMLASVLAGIALGGAAGALLASSRERASRCLSLAQLLVALGAVAAWLALQHALPLSTELSVRIGFGLLVLLPLAFAIGLTFPLAVRVLARDAADAGHASARIYAWNTLGAIAGSLAGGLVLIPWLRYEGAVQCAVDVSCLLAVLAATLLPPVRWRWSLAIGAPAALLVALFWPGVPAALLMSSPIIGRSQGETLFYAVGRSATVNVVGQGNLLLLRTNGLPEAAMTRRGSLPQFNGELWMPSLAVLARPEMSDLLMVGYGAGGMIDVTPPSVRSIDVIELEPQVIAANAAVGALRSTDPLLDPRVNIIFNDARGALSLSTRRYDAIVSQPSHPWTAGASHLYTREFMQQARAHLNRGGVFVQWMNIEYLDAALLRSLVATLRGVFAHLQVYRADANTLLFVASDASLQPEHAPAQLQSTLDRSPRLFARVGITVPEDLLGALVLDDAGAQRFAAGAAPISDDRNALATARVRDQHRALDADALSVLLAPYDPLQQRDSFIYRELRSRLDFTYLGRRVSAGNARAASLRLVAMSAALAPSPESGYLQALAASPGGAITGQAQSLLRGALQRYPDNDPLRYELIHPQFGALAFGSASAELQADAARLGPQPTLVLTAARAAAQSQWQQLAALDAQLAQIPPTAPWSAEATQLRVEWRVRVRNPGLQTQLCGEALRLVDEAALQQPNPTLRALRAWAGFGLHRADVVVESVSSFARSVLAPGVRTSAESAALRALLPPLQALMDQIENADPAEHERWQSARAELAAAAART